MNHTETTATKPATLEPSDWEIWVGRAEKLAGHSLDGNQTEDGYSLSGASAAWEAGATPAQYVSGLPVTRQRLAALAMWLNHRYILPLAQIATSGPRQGLADETPYLQVARAHTPADVIAAVSIEHNEIGFRMFRIEVYTSTAWGDMGDPFTVLKFFNIADAAHAIQRYIPYTPTV